MKKLSGRREPGDQGRLPRDPERLLILAKIRAFRTQNAMQEHKISSSNARHEAVALKAAVHLRIAGSLPVKVASLLTGKYLICARTHANSEARGYLVGARARAEPNKRLTGGCAPCHRCYHLLPQSVPVLAALGGSGRCHSQLCWPLSGSAEEQRREAEALAWPCLCQENVPVS